MTLFESIHSFLTGNSTLAAKVPGGVVPEIIPQGTGPAKLPIIVIRLIPGMSEKPTLDGGSSPWTRCRIETTVWGTSFKVCEQCSILIGNMFNSVNGPLHGTSDAYFSTTATNGPRSVHDTITRLVGVQLDIIGMLNTDTLS